MFPYQPISALDSSMGRMSNMRQPYNVYEQEQIIRQYQPQQPVQNNPYDEYVSYFNGLDTVTQNKIAESNEYINAKLYCDQLVTQHIYNQVAPVVLQQEQGYLAFKKLLDVTKSCKGSIESTEKLELSKVQEELKQTQQRLQENEKQLFKLQQGGVNVDNEPTSPKKPNRTGNRQSVQNDSSKS